VSNLAGFEIELLRDGAVVDRGHAANVLDGPLSALRLVRAWRWLTPCSASSYTRGYPVLNR
jgi:hypothetical protein